LLGVEGWAELRREHFVCGVLIKELARRTGMSRNTIRSALLATEPPRYERVAGGLKLDRFKAEVHRLLEREPAMPGRRIRELIGQLGFDGGKTIVDDYLREVRPLFVGRGRFSGPSIARARSLPVRPVGAAGGDPGRARPDTPRLGRDRVFGLLARRRRRADLLQADTGPASGRAGAG
jgi:hypothetical protein